MYFPQEEKSLDLLRYFPHVFSSERKKFTQVEQHLSSVHTSCIASPTHRCENEWIAGNETIKLPKSNCIVAPVSVSDASYYETLVMRESVVHGLQIHAIMIFFKFWTVSIFMSLLWPKAILQLQTGTSWDWEDCSAICRKDPGAPIFDHRWETQAAADFWRKTRTA